MPYDQRVELLNTISGCHAGAVFVVAKLDRLGRTMEDCISRVAEMLDRDIHVQNLNGRVDTKGLGKMVVGLLAAAVVIERDLLLERIAEGLKRAVGSAVKLDRKRTWDEGQSAWWWRCGTRGWATGRSARSWASRPAR